MNSEAKCCEIEKLKKTLMEMAPIASAIKDLEKYIGNLENENKNLKQEVDAKQELLNDR